MPARFGRYTVIRPLARGGMAELFLARQDGIGGFEKLVVIKRVLEELAGDRDIVSMLGDEARLGAQLQHPNIVQVHELGEQDGRVFYVMEFLEGENLRSIWRRVIARDGGFPLPIAIAIVRSVAAALHHAHEARDLAGRRLSVIHRDISPHNVIVTYQGAVKLVDFGIAKAHNRRSQKTRTGTLKGKLSYMSPEQAQARALDRRSDVFSLGIVLWELLSGVRLFDRESDFETLRAIIEEPILPVGVHLSDIPPELEAIVQRALTRDLDLRFPSARALDEALERVVLDHRLAVSDLQIAEFMDRHYTERIDSWRAAHREGGSAIAQHFSVRELPTLDSNQRRDGMGFEATVQHTPVQGPRFADGDPPVPSATLPRASRRRARLALGMLIFLAGAVATFAASTWVSRMLRARHDPLPVPEVSSPAVEPAADPAADLAHPPAAAPPERIEPSARDASPVVSPLAPPPPVRVSKPTHKHSGKAKSVKSRRSFDPDSALPDL